MDILDPERYRKALPVLAPLFSTHLAVRAILEKSVPGLIVVDDIEQPQAAMARTSGRYFLAGSDSSESFPLDLQQLFHETIFPNALEKGEIGFLLFYDSPHWEAGIDTILKNKHPQKTRRQYYVHQSLPPNWKSSLPQDFSLRFVDAELLSRKDLINMPRLREEVCSEQPSIEGFLETNFGVVLLHGNEIAGWCLSEYNSGDSCEIGIETCSPYQRRGFGTLMTCALVESAFLKGISRIGWDCYADNLPSSATARKAGFILEKEYPAYSVRFKNYPLTG